MTRAYRIDAPGLMWPQAYREHIERMSVARADLDNCLTHITDTELTRRLEGVAEEMIRITQFLISEADAKIAR